MRSFLRSVGGRKKKRCLGSVAVVDREEFEGMELDGRVEMIQGLIHLGLMHVQELMKQEVEALAEGRYARKTDEAAGRRFGSNPGTVRLAGQRVPIQVPRVRGERGEIPLRSYGALKDRGDVD